MRSIKKPLDLQRLVIAQNPLNFNLQEETRLKSKIRLEWETHVAQTTSNFFDKNKLYMQTLSESKVNHRVQSQMQTLKPIRIE